MHGNKADNLKKIQSLGLPVPDFYTIDASLLDDLDNKNVRDQLLGDYAAWRKKYNVIEVAVRSSADDEDSDAKSFAGQFASVMKVKSDKQFIDALRLVSSSKPDSGYDHSKNHRVHAIVQHYIEPTAAGVIFTVNPSNGLSEMLINVAEGHGGKVVDGQDALAIHYDRESGMVRWSNKDAKKILDETTIKSLAELARKIESYMGGPQDIEWAVQGSDIHILQSRPITRINYLKVWDNANIGESFPGIVLPLTFSIARRGYELVYKSQAIAGGMSWHHVESNHRTFHDMVGLFNGRMYYNLASWYRFIGLFPGNHRNQKFLDEQLQTIGDVVYLPPQSYPFKQAVRFYSRMLRRSLFFEREKRRYWQTLDAAFTKYDALPLDNSLNGLLKRYEFVEQMIVPHMGRSADNDFLVMTYHGIIKRKLRQWLGEKEGDSSNFLGALHDVISARQAELLLAIADTINQDKTARNHLKNKEYTALDAYLKKGDASSTLKEYRSKFLHRFAGDQKIEATNPLLNIEGFYDLIATYCKLDQKVMKNQRETALIAERRNHQVITSKLGPVRKIIYALLLKRLKHHLRIREHNRLLRGKTYALLRDLFPSVGTALVNADIINEPSDVYYLDIEEILRYINGTGYNDDLKNIVENRKQAYDTYQTVRPASRFITTGLTNIQPELLPVQSTTAHRSLSGTLSSPGDITGKVLVLDEPIIPKEPFDILVVSHTDPGWTPLIALAKGIVVEHGGILSHAAIITRELGIPSIIGVEGATQILKTGMRVRINAAKSSVDII